MAKRKTGDRKKFLTDAPILYILDPFKHPQSHLIDPQLITNNELRDCENKISDLTQPIG